MANTIHVDLLYHPSVEAPERFFELRRCGSQVWTAEGGIYTFGEDHLIDCDNSNNAEAVAAQIIADKSVEGFMHARSLAYKSNTFDYGTLTAEIARGLKEFWRNLNAEHSSIGFNRLALNTDDDAMTISVHAQASSPDEEDYIGYNPQEWAHSGKHELEIAYRILLAKHRDIPFEPTPPHYDDNVLECMMRAMERLRAESLIGDHVMMWVDISDSGQIAGMFKRLNSRENAKELDDYFGEDADRSLELTI